MSDRRKEAEEKMAKAIFISGDCWLCVFDLLPASQLGLGISMISRRFDFYVDEHFKTRKWALKSMELFPKYEADGTVGMGIVNYDGKLMPIPQNPLPKKVVGFKRIIIESCFNNNSIAFLRRFRPIFAAFPINLAIHDVCMTNNYNLDLVLRNIWPMIATNICAIQLSAPIFRFVRTFVPSILDDFPSLRIFNACFNGFFAEFPADDSANASDGQAVAKWLFTPLQNDVPKVFKCLLRWYDGHFASMIEGFKAAFASASSPVNFIVYILFRSSFRDPVLLFDLTNELTREQLTLERINNSCRLLLIRCPIVRDEIKWTKWEEEAIGLKFIDQWNRIDIRVS